MAGGVDIKIEFPELEAIKTSFRGLPKTLAAKHMGAALNKAIEPGLKALKTLTPRGPTGNLRKAIKKKVKRYTGSLTSRNPAKSPGAAVALAGFTAPPRKKSADLSASEKGFHGGFLEFGTKDRKTKGRIASSFSRSGAVRVVVAKRSGRITTKPRPPKGFLKAAPKGGTVDLGAFPIGGKAGVPPVRTAFKRSSSAMRSLMAVEMTKSLNQALKEMASPFGKGRRD